MTKTSKEIREQDIFDLITKIQNNLEELKNSVTEENWESIEVDHILGTDLMRLNLIVNNYGWENDPQFQKE